MIRNAAILGLLTMIASLGCGGAPEEGAKDHLESQTAKDHAAEAAQKYREGAGKGDPNAAPAAGQQAPPAP